MRIDLHNHTTLCKHASGSMEEYIQQAIKLDIDIFGFSCHAPMEFDKEYRMSLAQSKIYQKDILHLQKQYKNQIKILSGYEVDFMSNPNFIEQEILNADVDYLIGSVHFLTHQNSLWGFDNPEFIKTYETSNINNIWEDYFEAIKQMAKTQYFNIVGHLDLIKVFKYLPTKDIKLMAYEALKQIKQSNMVIEINSAGLRKPINEPYPSKALLELAFELNIPITFGSDAHKIEQIGFGYNQAISLAKSIGYTKCISFEKKEKIIHNF